MRPIKFRAFNRKTKEWWFIELLNSGLRVGAYEGDIEFEDTYEDWQEFTGLLDKSGKEIFEGDILKAIGKESGEEIIKEVKWADDGAAFYTDYVFSWPAVMKGEVIGNIYENPELLNP